MGRRRSALQLARSSSSIARSFIIVVFFWAKYAVPRQIKPGIVDSTTSRGQRNLCTVFIFISCEEKGCYRDCLLSYRFVRTPKFWLPIVLRAQPPYARICLVGLVWFAMHCGKMYSRHLFSYDGLRHVIWHVRHGGAGRACEQAKWTLVFLSMYSQR